METALQSCLFLLMLNNLLMLGSTRIMWLIRFTAFQGILLAGMLLTMEHALLAAGAELDAGRLDGKAVPILMYASGPGAAPVGELRPDPTGVDTADPDLRTFAAVPLYSAAHTGEDIATYATGPASQGIHGLMDHPAVFEVMRKALALP